MKIRTIMVVIVLTALVSYGAAAFQNHSGINFGERREIVLTGLAAAIENAKLEGNYDCCIEPACTMCYLGSWKWNDGICRCDEMMEQGRMDMVCPECLKGKEEGLCKSSDGASCSIATELEVI